MAKQGKNAITPTRAQDYPEWYQQVIKAADLAENSPVRGCMVIKPWGFSLWENMQRQLDDMFKETGHMNAYFPLFIPLSYLEKEAAHVDGFAKECAVVTHHRLVPDGKGGLQPASPLDEPLVVRPTSETIIGESYAKWVQSYRDLPILINQWANVVRWEMRTRIFLRTSEFLWQEGHTVHATEKEAREETERMLRIYGKFAEEHMAMPVIMGEKTSDERFPGAVNTYSIEAMMQDHKALQAGTSHFLGQNFAKASGITFMDANEKEQTAWTTSWGVSTRLIGGLIMTHSDDDGLILPPKLAPRHVALMPIYRNDDEKAQVLAYCDKLKDQIQMCRYHDRRVLVEYDNRDLSAGIRSWDHIKKGVPIRVEVGPRDMSKDSLFVGRRDKAPKDKQSVGRQEFVEKIPQILDEIQTELLTRARSFRKDATRFVSSEDEFNDFFKNEGKNEQAAGFAICHAADDEKISERLKPLKVTARCIPLDDNEKTAKCIFTGQDQCKKIVFAKSY